MKTNCLCNSKSSALNLALKKLRSLIDVLGMAKPRRSEFSKKVMLGNGNLWRMESQSEIHQIECLQGKIWITQSGCMADIVLTEGQKQRVGGSGLVLVQALNDSELFVQ